MLSLPADEHVSPAVAREAVRRVRGMRIAAMRHWEWGHFLGTSDEIVLREAHRQRLTLVTFDLRTIPPLLRRWAEHGIDHSGVVLVDGRTINPDDVGGLVEALGRLWLDQRRQNWLNRVVYLRSAR
jgi:hypothetical protein